MIEAVQLKPSNWREVMSFLGADFGGRVIMSLVEVEIPTLEGTMTASMNDWIIRGVKGELYPCKPDIFEATYEAVA